MKYIATREGVEVLTGKGPATEKQKEMVAKLLKDFPDVRDSFEYEDYKQAPTLHTASALISAALDSHMQNLQSENGYLKYIATRPGAEKHGAHGLFGRQENTDLPVAMHDLTAHDGNVWTIIYSLHREDAERLGYNNAAAWRKLLVSQQNKFAEAFHVPVSSNNKLSEQLRRLKQEKARLLDTDSDDLADRTRDLMDALEDGPDFLDSFDAELFDALVEKIIVDSNERLRFRLKNGLELLEQIERTRR